MIESVRLLTDECWPVGGGHLSVFVYRSRTVEYTYDADGNVLTITPGGPIWELPVFPDSIELKEIDKTDGGGWQLDTLLNFTTLNRPEVRSWKEHLRFEHLNALIVKSDGSMRVVGTKETPLKMQGNANDGQKFADRQKIEMQLAGMQLRYSPLYLPD